MKKIEIPSMKREERSNVMSFIRHGFTCTMKEVQEATGFTKEEILSKLEELCFVSPWEKNPSFLFSVNGKKQPVPYSVTSYVYTKGGAKNYGRDTLWLFKPYIIEILLGKELETDTFELLYVLTEEEYEVVKDVLPKKKNKEEMILVSASDDIWMTKKECDELGIPY